MKEYSISAVLPEDDSTEQKPFTVKYPTGISYNDTQESFDDGMLALKPDCSVTYRENVYRFKDFDRQRT